VLLGLGFRWFFGQLAGFMVFLQRSCLFRVGVVKVVEKNNWM
jgi:hypothetical protein